MVKGRGAEDVGEVCGDRGGTAVAGQAARDRVGGEVEGTWKTIS